MGVKHEYKMHIKFALRSSKIRYVKIYEDIYIYNMMHLKYA